jgi:hypothetical protein
MNRPTQTTEGIWIPRTIWLAPGLSLREKALLAQVSAATPDGGYRATNDQLMGLLDIQERHVRSCIAALRDKGFITVRLGPNRERILRITGKHARLAKTPTGAKRPAVKTRARRGKTSQRSA